MYSFNLSASQPRLVPGPEFQRFFNQALTGELRSCFFKSSYMSEHELASMNAWLVWMQISNLLIQTKFDHVIMALPRDGLFFFLTHFAMQNDAPFSLVHNKVNFSGGLCTEWVHPKQFSGRSLRLLRFERVCHGIDTFEKVAKSFGEVFWVV